MNRLSARVCAQLVRDELRSLGITATVRARTVSFMDLARDSKVFVTVTPWVKDERIRAMLGDIAKCHRFCLNFEE